MLVDVIEHMVGIVGKLSSHIQIHIQIHAKHSLELPQCENHSALCIIYVRDCICKRCLGSEKFHFRCLLRIIGRVYTGYFENGRVVPVETETPDADTTTDGAAESGEVNS
mgnify:CR=1 FL=1